MDCMEAMARGGGHTTCALSVLTMTTMEDIGNFLLMQHPVPRDQLIGKLSGVARTDKAQKPVGHSGTILADMMMVQRHR